MSSQGRCCCPERKLQQQKEQGALRGTHASPPSPLAYRLPFLPVSLEIGWINFLLLASSEAAELQKIISIRSWFASDLLLLLNRFGWARGCSERLPPPLQHGTGYVVLQSSWPHPGTHTSWFWGNISCRDCRTGVSSSLHPRLMRYVRCLCVESCYHTSLWPRNLWAYQPANV